VGDDRAETYLRLLAETELRRILRLLDRVGRWRDDGPDPMPLPPGAFPVRLTPPLGACPDAIEVVVTGPVTRIRAVVPVRDIQK